MTEYCRSARNPAYPSTYPPGRGGGGVGIGNYIDFVDYCGLFGPQNGGMGKSTGKVIHAFTRNAAGKVGATSLSGSRSDPMGGALFLDNASI